MTKWLRFLLCASLLGLCTLHLRADDDDDDSGSGADEVPDFSHLEDIHYKPKYTLSLGMRYAGGVRANFHGNGNIPAPEGPPPDLSSSQNQTYHDGSIGLDSRVTAPTENPQPNSSNQPTYSESSTPIVPDNQSNTWAFASASQLTTGVVGGTPTEEVMMHDYSAITEDSGVHDATGKKNNGLELSLSRDMGQLTKRLSWQVFAGFSTNSIEASTFTAVNAAVTTITDTYGLTLNGNAVPNSGASYPTQEPVPEPDSTPSNPDFETGSDGSQIQTDNSILISNSPIAARSISGPVLEDGVVVDHYKVHGAYAALRLGPELSYQLTRRLSFNVEFGPSITYAGTNFNVTENFIAPTGSPIIDTIDDNETKGLLGYYADATLDYDLNDTTGFFLGSYYQTSGKYTQTIDDSGGYYAAHIDVGNADGLRTGITMKF